jgi:hypothetical protein
MANFSQSIAVTNLATHTLIIPTTDVYSFQGTLQLPNIVPSATQGAGDTITIVRSSSLAQDNQLNAIKMTIAISEGPL